MSEWQSFRKPLAGAGLSLASLCGAFNYYPAPSTDHMCGLATVEHMEASPHIQQVAMTEAGQGSELTTPDLYKRSVTEQDSAHTVLCIIEPGRK